MTRRAEVPESILYSLLHEYGEAQLAAERASASRMRIARALAEAQADGCSVRQLAEVLDVQPTTVQRLIAAAKS